MRIMLKNFNLKTFPTVFKTSVNHSFKSRNIHKSCNNRIISILPVVSKITEKVIAEQLKEQLNRNNLLYLMQLDIGKHFPLELLAIFFLLRL